VVGGLPVKVTKANGTWTIAFDMVDLVTRVPSVSDLANEYWIVYDAAQQTYFKVLLSSLGVAGARLQRAANATPIVVASNDQIINFNVNGVVTCTLPAASSRNGAPLTFHDAGGHVSAVNTATFTPAAGDTIDSQANVVMTTKNGEITLRPYNDGTNTGWSLQ
jgi:hypothetical protein